MSLLAWMSSLGRLSVEDLRLVSDLATKLASAERAQRDTARVMLDAQPPPADANEARDRIRAVARYLNA